MTSKITKSACKNKLSNSSAAYAVLTFAAATTINTLPTTTTITPRIVIHSVSRNVSLSFGKHKGKSVDYIIENEPGYLGWILNADFPMYTKKVLTKLRLSKLNNKL